MAKSIKEELYSYKDIKYQEFTSRLLPNTKNIIGVRIPILRKIAKRIAKENPYEYLENVKNETYEETMLEGLVIGYLKDDFNNIKKYIVNFIPKIDNWSVCDTFCANLKIVKSHEKEIFSLIKKYINKDEYSVRFSLVMLLNYYVNDKYIDDIFEIIDCITNKAYYVKMAQAWLIQKCYAKYKIATVNYLKTSNLDDWVYNKAIQKIIESNKTTNSEKENLKSTKRK